VIGFHVKKCQYEDFPLLNWDYVESVRSGVLLIKSSYTHLNCCLFRYQKHGDECSYQPVCCINVGCNEEVLRKDVITHVETACLWSVIECAFCSERFPKLEKKVSYW